MIGFYLHMCIYIYIYNLYVYTWIEWGICYIFLIIILGLPAYKNVFRIFSLTLL